MPNRFVDPVVEEIHAIRAAMLEAAGGDIRVLMQQVTERQERSDRRIIREPLRPRAAVDRTGPIREETVK
jgi:hypothetical protein